ncbi:MAG: hypothetical protein V6Z78_03740 [Holosporaceae bacterium]
MTFLKQHLFILILVFLSLPFELLQGNGSAIATLDDVAVNHTPSAAQSMLSAATYPLDLMKKASLCVMKAPLFFLAATSALPLAASSQGFHHPVMEEPASEISDEITCGLTAAWDTETCSGRALNATHKQAFLEKQAFCQEIATCMPSIVGCTDPRVSQRSNKDRVSNYCIETACSPDAKRRINPEKAQQAVAACTEKLCEQEGVPYTGRFACTAADKYEQNLIRRDQFDDVILKAEECLERFCQTYAHDTCPQEPFWWQSLFGISPCNEDLCAGRFIPDEQKEVTRGVFQSLEEVGKDTLERCKGMIFHKGPITPLRILQGQDT